MPVRLIMSLMMIGPVIHKSINKNKNKNKNIKNNNSNKHGKTYKKHRKIKSSKRRKLAFNK